MNHGLFLFFFLIATQSNALFFLFCSDYNEERPEVPMLFRDVPSLLIIFVLTMPQPLRRGTTHGDRVYSGVFF